jgi:hypothetical protein
MTGDPDAHAPFTYSDLPLEKAREWAHNMTCHSTPSFKEKLTYAGYNDINVHYIICDKDMIILPEVQQGMVEMIKESSGRDVQVHHLDCGHVPIVSRPDDLAVLLKEILGSL